MVAGGVSKWFSLKNIEYVDKITVKAEKDGEKMIFVWKTIKFMKIEENPLENIDFPSKITIYTL